MHSPKNSRLRIFPLWTLPRPRPTPATINTPTTCSACGKSYPQYKPASAHFSRCKERSSETSSELRSQPSANSLPSSVPSSPSASPPQQYTQCQIVAFANEPEPSRPCDRTNLASMPQPTPPSLPEWMTDTPSTPVLPTQRIIRGYLDAGTPTNENSLHLFLEESVMSPPAPLPSQSPTRSPIYLSQVEPNDVVEARFLANCCDPRPLTTTPTTQGYPTAACSTSTTTPADDNNAFPDLFGPPSLPTLFRHPSPAPRSMQRRYVRTLASDYFGSSRSPSPPPPSSPPPPTSSTGDALLTHINNNLLPHLQDSPEQDPDLSRADPEFCEEPATTTDITTEPYHFTSPAATNPTSRTAITPPTTPEIPTDAHPSQEDGPAPTHPGADQSDDLPCTGENNNDASKAKLEQFRRDWEATFSQDLTWDDFSQACVVFVDAALPLAREISSAARTRPGPRRPAARPPNPNRRQPQFDAREAQRIQTLYRNSRKRAVRKVIGDNSPFYTCTSSEAATYFQTTFGHRACDPVALQQELNEHVPIGPSDEGLCYTPTADEISKKLHQMANSSPGKDRLEYRHIKSIDPSCKLLTLIFARCFEEQDVPLARKTATTILIHKKGPSNDIGNLRPIALMACTYKLLMSVLARRLSTWAIDNDIMSCEQKSARPSEGCYEHTFLLKSLVGDARRNQKDVYLAWLDLRNAFGSIPHQAIFTTLNHIGIPPPLVNLIRNAYTNATTEIRTEQGLTESIPIYSGVKQGCPLSPILFNLTTELILRKIKATAQHNRGGPALHHKFPVSVLAYADDLVLITRKPHHLQHLLDSASAAANLLGLHFRPDKSASLSVIKSKRHNTDRPVEHHEFHVQEQLIPFLKKDEHYRYLGVPIGLIHNIDDLDHIVDKTDPGHGKTGTIPTC